MKIDHDKSNIRWLSQREMCPVCHPEGKTISELLSLVLDEENYEGIDVFVLNETGMRTYVSEGFVEFAIKNRLSNLGISPINDLRHKIIIDSGKVVEQNM